jgi:hypothetical protein
MPDDLYDRDILAWSAQQADLLRRAARGERVNGVDWDHVVEEIEDVGISELNAVRSYLRQMLVHLLKPHGWPNSQSASQWRVEIAAFQADAAQRFAPSMRQKIDLDTLYQRAVEQLEGVHHDGIQPVGWPAQCPCTLEQLLGERRAVLEQRFGAVS